MTEQEKSEAQGADPKLSAHKNVGVALLEARKSVAATVQKKGEKTEGGGGRYNYVGHEHVVLHCRRALHDNGLTFTQVSCVMLVDPVRWCANFVLEHAGSFTDKAYGPFECTLPANGKEAFIASTALDRTAMLRIMGIAGSAEEDPEHNVNNRNEPATTQTTQARVQEMQGKRDSKNALVEAKERVLNRHIAELANMQNLQGLVEWAGWLVAGNDGTNDPQFANMPNSEKLKAWNAYGERCVALNIRPESTTEAYSQEARMLRNRGVQS